MYPGDIGTSHWQLATIRSGKATSCNRCTTYTVRRTLYDVQHCTTYIVRRTLYDVYCTTYSVHCTTYTVRTLYDVLCTTYTVRRTLYDVLCTTYCGCIGVITVLQIRTSRRIEYNRVVITIYEKLTSLDPVPGTRYQVQCTYLKLEVSWTMLLSIGFRNQK